jgi:flagellar biosynthesis protein FlhF
LRTTLRSLDIAENTINELIKKATFEFSKEDAQDVDLVFEYALREMLERIPTALPQFSNIDEEESAFVTLLLSDSSCGQTSMLYKLGALKKGSLLIQYQPGKQEKFAEKIFNLEVQRVESVAEIVSAVRKANEKGQSVFVDYRNFKTELNDTKKFIEGLRRSFGKVEVMICLSAIHSELYNRKVAATYESIADGMVVTNLDLCLNYGALFNVCDEFQGLPLKFFGTGDVIPEDIEAATGERVLAGMFKLD